MATGKKQASVRIQLEGKAEVKAGLKEVKDAGNEAFASVAQAADQSGAALDRNADKIQRNAEALANYKAKASVAAIDAPAAVTSVNPSTPKVTFAQKKLAAGIIADIDPVTAAEDRYAKAVKRADDSLAAKLITEKQHADYLAKHKKVLDDVTASQTKAGNATELSAHQMKMLAIQLPDVFQGLLGGQPIWQVFIQQGGQAAQIAGMGPGGFGSALRALVSPAALAGIGIAGVGVAAAVMALQMHKGAEEAVRLENALKLTGSTSGLVGNDLYSIGDKIAASARVSASSVREVEATILQTGKAGRESFDQLVEGSVLLAKATGGTASDAFKTFEPLLGDTTAAALALNERFHALTEEQLKQIDALQRHGDKQGAVRVAMEALLPAFREQSENLGYLEKSWRGVGQMIDAAIDSMARWGRTQPTDTISQFDAQIDKLEKRKAALEADLAPKGLVGQLADFGTYGAGLDSHKKQLQDQLTLVNAQLDGARGVQKALKDQTTELSEQKNLKEKAAALDLQYSEKNAAAIRKLEEDKSDLEKANRAELGDKEAHNKAIANIDKQIESLKKPEKVPGAARAESLARQAASVEANTRATLDLARAYLVSDAAALKAESDRKALTQATKQGTDVEAAKARQLALTVAEQAASGAKNVAALSGQTAAQKRVNDAVAAGTLTAAEAQKALQNEAQLRPLLVAQALAEGEAKSALTDIIDKLRVAQADLNAQQAVAALQSGAEANRDQIDFLKLQLALIGKTNEQRAIEIAQYQARKQIADSAIDINDPSQLAAGLDAYYSATGAAKGQNGLDRAKYTDDIKRQQADELEQTRLKLEMVGKSEAQQEQALDRLRLEQQLRHDLGDLTSQEARDILAAADAQDEMNARLRKAAAAQDELRGMQDDVFDKLQAYLEEGKYSWKSFGEFGKSVIQDLIAEMIKLAAINPLKNILRGNDDLPTISSVFKKASDTGATASTLSNIASLLGFESGTDNAPPGWAWVGESGPELRKLRAGDVIKSHGESMRMASASQALRQAPVLPPLTPIGPQHFNQTNTVVNHNIDLRGAWVDKDVWAEVKKLARDVSIDVTTQGLEQFDQTLPDRVDQIQRDPRAR